MQVAKKTIDQRRKVDSRLKGPMKASSTMGALAKKGKKKKKRRKGRKQPECKRSGHQQQFQRYAPPSEEVTKTPWLRSRTSNGSRDRGASGVRDAHAGSVLASTAGRMMSYYQILVKPHAGVAQASQVDRKSFLTGEHKAKQEAAGGTSGGSPGKGRGKNSKAKGKGKKGKKNTWQEKPKEGEDGAARTSWRGGGWRQIWRRSPWGMALTPHSQNLIIVNCKFWFVQEVNGAKVKRLVIVYEQGNMISSRFFYNDQPSADRVCACCEHIPMGSWCVSRSPKQDPRKQCGPHIDWNLCVLFVEGHRIPKCKPNFWSAAVRHPHRVKIKANELENWMDRSSIDEWKMAAHM